MSAPDRFFVAGGPLRSDDPSYIERSADRELRQELVAGEYCYVLTPRQMGKSSLMARTARRLRAAGTRVAVLDLTAIGGGAEQPVEQWYYGLLYRLRHELRIRTPLKPWWDDRARLPPAQRFVEYFREVVLSDQEKVVVFLDEIDSTIKLPFSDGFFAAVRACYSARATEPDFARLSFVLLGVATPDQLISDAKRTPFNVGRRIELDPFDHDEAEGLTAGLGGDAAELLGRILFWTGGQPYLTQALCQLAAEASKESDTADATARVDALVTKRFLVARASREETHLSHIQTRLLDQPGARARLSLYRRVLRGDKVTDSPASPAISTLKLAGVIRPGETGEFRVSNRVYRRLFDCAWVRSKMPANPRFVVTVAVATSLLGLVSWYAFLVPGSWIEDLELTKDHAVATRAHNALSNNLLFSQAKADGLFADYWDRSARAAEVRNRDEGLLYWLRAAQASVTELRRRSAARLVGHAWEQLSATMRHSGDVRAVAFSPDGKTVLTGSTKAIAHLWHADSGSPIGDPMSRGPSALAVAFSPDRKAVLAGGSGGIARLWHLDTGMPIGDPMRHNSSVNAVAFSPDGKTVLTGSTDGTARLWKVDMGASIDDPMHSKDSVVVVLTADPAHLLADWQQRLALVFDAASKLTPRWPIAPARDPKSGEPGSHRGRQAMRRSLSDLFEATTDSTTRDRWPREWPMVERKDDRSATAVHRPASSGPPSSTPRGDRSGQHLVGGHGRVRARLTQPAETADRPPPPPRSPHRAPHRSSPDRSAS